MFANEKDDRERKVIYGLVVERDLRKRKEVGLYYHVIYSVKYPCNWISYIPPLTYI